MYRATTYCLAGSVGVALAAMSFAAFTTPPWPAPAYYGGTNKDARVSQVYSACVERSYAAFGFNAMTSTPRFIYEREACVRFKAFVVSAHTNFVDTTQAGTDSTFSAYFAAHPSADAPPVLSITQLLASVGAPTNYFEHTPWQQLNGGGYPISNAYTYGGYSELDYGWRYATNILAAMRATYSPAWWQDKTAVDDASEGSCGAECGTSDSVNDKFQLIQQYAGIQTTGGLFAVATGTNDAGAINDRCLAELPPPTYMAYSSANGFVFQDNDVIGWEADWQNVFTRPLGKPLVAVPAHMVPPRIDFYVRDVWWTLFCGYGIEGNPANTNANHTRLLWTAGDGGVGPIDLDEPTCDYGSPGTNLVAAFAQYAGGDAVFYDPWRGKVPTADDLKGAFDQGCVGTEFATGNNGLSLECYAQITDCTGPTVENEAQFRSTMTAPIVGEADDPLRVWAVVFWPFDY